MVLFLSKVNCMLLIERLESGEITLKTGGLEAFMQMLFFKFSVIIIGFCVKSEVW